MLHADSLVTTLMTSDRWEEINRLYNAAVEVEEKERTPFLEKACGEDGELRREVESLLAYDQQAQQFIDRPALQVTAEKLAGEPPSLIGRKLGPYQIQGVLGAGGMGEVYKAKDTRLNRTVAIKVLPRLLSERADLRQRFEREARAIASLDHPHICALYDVGHEGATDFLVMQYLDGETLSQRLRKGALPTAEVMRYAVEIAGALEQAHRKGVVHRDLKPGNIMLTETGGKLLDFGLAKRTGGAGALRTLIGAEEGSGTVQNVRGSARPTQSESLTEEGMILGTLEYMAPEQLEGKEADARTDIFALGVVIYEMATGRKAFERDSKASLIAKILTFQPPPIGTLQPVSPPELDRVVQRCLAKKPEERWQSAAELTSQLQEIAEANFEILRTHKRGKEPSGEAKEIESKGTPAVPMAIPESPNILSRLIRSRAWQLGFAGVLLAVIAGSFDLWRMRQQPQKLLGKKEMSFKSLTSYSWDDPVDATAISPDGKYLAFGLKQKLFIQVVRSGDKRSLALPEGFYPTRADWFPDGTKLLLWRDEPRWTQVKGETIRESNPSLWSLSILGGTPQKILDNAFAASVSPDGSLIAFSRHELEQRTTGIWLAGANGENPRRIHAPTEPNQSYFGPIWSADGERLFYFHPGRGIESCDLHGERVTTVRPSQEYSRPVSICLAPEGRMLFGLLEFQPASLAADIWEIKVDTATGRPLDQVRRITQWSTFASGQLDDVNVTADGKTLVARKGHAQWDVYVADLEPGGTAMKIPRRLTINENDDAARGWTADSRSVLFESNRNGSWDIFKQDIDHTEAAVVAATAEQEHHPQLSPNGNWVLYLVSRRGRDRSTRLLRVPVGGGPPEAVLTGENLKNFSCAREANLCVVAEDVAGKRILTTFDPLKGRGETLPQPDYPDSGRGILSPQGQLIEKMKQGPEGLHIRVRSLTAGSAEEVTFKNLTKKYSFMGWSLNGKAIYICDQSPFESDFTVLYAGLDGHSQVLWKRGTSPGYSFDYPIPSPDGRHLAFTVVTYEMNAWMLENF
ncbi:MAG: serine/threonine-protein kinase [Acidobacteria bacterium]|nr:serine/threonine-protein kinase [Acidobacteriota bacterium]